MALAATAASFVLSRALSTTAVDASLDRAKSPEDYERILATFANVRACAVLQMATSVACLKAMHACIDGRFKIVEFTLTTPDCLDHLSDFGKEYEGDVMVECGTIMDTDDAEAAVDAGVEFIITPVMLPDVIQWCARQNVVVVPG